MSVSDKPFYFPDSGFSFECILAKEYQIDLFGLLVIEKLVVLGAMPQIKCNAKNNKKQTNINWMSRLSSLKFVLGMFDLLTHIQLIPMHGETLCCQTVKPCASLQAHTYSLCAAVAGRCYKMDGSIMSLKTTG